MRTQLRAATLALLLAPACLLIPAGGCQSTSQQDSLTVQAYLENAAQYYDSGHFERAYQQWDKALAIDDGEERARLGQSMALYQLGREETQDGLARLAESERRLDELRKGGLGASLAWKAEIGYGLVQQRYAELCDRKLRKIESSPLPARDVKTADVVRAELARRIAEGDRSFQRVLADEHKEPAFELTCWLALARGNAMRGDFKGALTWCEKFERAVVTSKDFWKKQGKEYATKLFGAELQEAELRDVMANCQFKLGAFDESERQLSELLKLQPERADAYLNRGRLRFNRKAWDLARSDITRFLSLSPRPKDDPVVMEAASMLVDAEAALDAESGK